MTASRLALVVAACAALAGCAAPGPGCAVAAHGLPAQALYGTWEARIEGMPGRAVMRLDRHPDYDGVSGTLTRSEGTAPAAASTTAKLAGDIDDEGLLSIDESMDGRAISGVWLGRQKAGSCGREFQGTWRNATDESTHDFVLKKMGS